MRSRLGGKKVEKEIKRCTAEHLHVEIVVLPVERGRLCLWPAATKGLLFIPHVIYEHGEPQPRSSNPCKSYSFTTSALDWGWVVSVTPRPRFTPGTHYTESWVGPRAGLNIDVRGKISSLPGIEPRTPSRRVRSQTLYWLSYAGSAVSDKGLKIFSRNINQVPINRFPSRFQLTYQFIPPTEGPGRFSVNLINNSARGRHQVCYNCDGRFDNMSAPCSMQHLAYETVIVCRNCLLISRHVYDMEHRQIASWARFHHIAESPSPTRSHTGRQKRKQHRLKCSNRNRNTESVW
jgi:hypothetical protein